MGAWLSPRRQRNTVPLGVGGSGMRWGGWLGGGGHTKGGGGSAFLPASDGVAQAGCFVGDATVTAPVTWRKQRAELAAKDA